jgi:hypothetical protein
MAKQPRGFQGSSFDNDKGVKQGSAADKKRDAKEIPAFKRAEKSKTRIAAMAPSIPPGKKGQR